MHYSFSHILFLFQFVDVLVHRELWWWIMLNLRIGFAVLIFMNGNTISIWPTKYTVTNASLVKNISDDDEVRAPSSCSFKIQNGSLYNVVCCSISSLCNLMCWLSIIISLNKVIIVIGSIYPTCFLLASFNCLWIFQASGCFPLIFAAVWAWGYIMSINHFDRWCHLLPVWRFVFLDWFSRKMQY